MKLLSILSATALASAVPLAEPVPPSQAAARLEARQSTTRNDLEDGNSSNCPSAILIFARGTTEAGNMVRRKPSTPPYHLQRNLTFVTQGTIVGPPLADTLEDSFPDIWVQGVGGPYAATTSPNFEPKGTNQQSIDEAKRLFALANTKCPDTPVVTAGYSQGTAVVGNALTESGGAIQNQVAGAVLFGYTKNQQNGGRIPNFPEEKTLVECRTGDAVCTGTLTILPAHLQYGEEARGSGAEFLVQRINAVSG